MVYTLPRAIKEEKENEEGVGWFLFREKVKERKGRNLEKKRESRGFNLCEERRELSGASGFTFFFSLSVGKLACTCITSSFFLFVF